MPEAPRTLHDSDETDVDPELVSLRRRTPVGPLLAASVLGFAALLMIRLRHDLVFAGRGEPPVDLGRIAAGSVPALPDDGYVTLAGEPDLRAPARVRGVQSTGHRLAPLMGTAGHVWVQEPGVANDVPAHYDGRYQGRLRRLEETGFGDELRQYVAALPPQPRIVFPDALADPLPERDAQGEALAVTPDTPVEVAERVAGAALVVVVKTDSIGDEPSAQRALAAAGLAGRAVALSDSGWTYEVAATPDEARARLRAARLFAAGAEPKLLTHQGTVAGLRVGADSIRLGERVVARAAVTHVTVRTPATLPEDVWVLQSGDSPAQLWYMRPLYGLLALIALLMLWALVVDVRHLRKQRADSTV